jgi:hypothetical protein
MLFYVLKGTHERGLLNLFLPKVTFFFISILQFNEKVKTSTRQ